MKAERAIEILDPQHREHYDSLEPVNEACRIGMKAIQKNMLAEKVLFEDVGYDQWHEVNIYACICPSCGLEIINFTDDDVKNSNSDIPEEMFHDCLVHHCYCGMNNFCNRCGQKIKWE